MDRLGAWGTERNRARLRLSLYILQTRFRFRKSKSENPGFVAESGALKRFRSALDSTHGCMKRGLPREPGLCRLEDLQRGRTDHVFHAQPVFLHMRGVEMGPESRQICPFFDDGHNVGTGSRLRGNAARDIDRWAVFEAAGLRPYFRDESPKLVEKRVPLTRDKFNGGDDVD